jgi:hypothetical protein
MLPIPGTAVPELRSQCAATRRPPAVARLRRIGWWLSVGPRDLNQRGSRGDRGRLRLGRYFHHRVHPVVPGRDPSVLKAPGDHADIDDARVYGGIHFRFEQDGGVEQGRRVGEYVQEQPAQYEREKM